MSIFLKRVGLGAVGCVALASCSSTGLERGGELGGAGAAFAGRISAGYTAAQGVYDRGDLLDCVNYYMNLPPFMYAEDREESPDCAREQREGDIAAGLTPAESALFDDRIALADSLARSYREFAALAADDPAPNLGPSLAAAAVQAERVQHALADERTWAARGGRRWTPQRRAELTAAANLIGASLDALARRDRLARLRGTSVQMRTMLAVLDAAYEYEAAVIDSIRTIDAERRRLAIETLRDHNLIDENSLGRLAHDALENAGVPIIDYSGNADAWTSPQSRALIDYLSQRSAQQSLDRAMMANSTVRAGLAELISIHRDFETRNELSTERLDAIIERIDPLFGEATP